MREMLFELLTIREYQETALKLTKNIQNIGNNGAVAKMICWEDQ